MKEQDGMIFVSYLMANDNFKEFWSIQNKKTQQNIIENLTCTHTSLSKELTNHD